MQFSFINGPISQKKPTCDISLDELMNMIIHNPYQKTIKALRMLDKDDLGYRALKCTLPTICVHGTFSYLNTSGLKQLSGYLYYDIDEGINDVDAFLMKFKGKHKEILSMCGKSVGGKGIFFYVKLARPDLLTPQNFRAVQKYIGDAFFSDYRLDANAKKLTQPNFISFDENLFVNKEASITIDTDVFNANDILNIDDNKNKNSKDKKIKGKTQYDINKTPTTEQHITLPFTFLDRNDFWHKIVWETPVDTKGDAYVVKPIDYVKLKLNKIKDGTKHKRFAYMVFVLRKLNPSFDFSTVYTFMYFVNEKYTCDCPMDNQKLLQLVSWAFQKYDASKVKTRIKKIHFAPDCGLTAAQKIRIANQENGLLKSINSKAIIRKAIHQLIEQNIEITKTAIYKASGLSRPTVHKYMEEVLKDFEVPTLPQTKDAIQNASEGQRVNKTPLNELQRSYATSMNLANVKQPHPKMITAREIGFKFNYSNAM